METGRREERESEDKGAKDDEGCEGENERTRERQQAQGDEGRRAAAATEAGARARS